MFGQPFKYWLPYFLRWRGSKESLPSFGGHMISHTPIPGGVDKTKLDQVRNWILAQCNGEKTAWPGHATTLWVKGHPFWVMAGAWEVRDAIRQVFVGNGNTPVPLWAVGALMSIARAWGLSNEERVTKAIEGYLARILAEALNPVMVNLAESLEGKPVTEIAINEKERLVVGRYPDAKGEPGPFRYMSGEVADVEGPGWLKLRL